MDSTQPEAFDTEPRMITPETMTTDQRLDRVEVTLRRICAELDICFRAQQALLVALNAKETARVLGEEFEQLHEREFSDRDTEPPGAA